MLGAVLRNITFTKDRYDSFIELQVHPSFNEKGVPSEYHSFKDTNYLIRARRISGFLGTRT